MLMKSFERNLKVEIPKAVIAEEVNESAIETSYDEEEWIYLHLLENFPLMQ